MNDLTESAATKRVTPNGVLPRSHPLNGRGDQCRTDAHEIRVPAADPLNADGGQKTADAQRDDAPTSTPSEVKGHPIFATQHRDACDLNLICDRLRELHRDRQDLHREEKSMTLRIKAKCRRICEGDLKEAGTLYRSMFNGADHEHALSAMVVSEPFIRARYILEEERHKIEKLMASEAKKLPVWSWGEEIRGFGVGSLAAIVGECGNISNYSTVSKLWKRLGLAVIRGERQSKKSDVELAIEHGYSPSRRAVMWNVGQAIFKSQSQRTDKETGEILREAGVYRQVYDKRKEYELGRVETKGHAHNRATRYMEKRFVKDLWKAWVQE